MSTRQTRGLKNNNPLNIRKGQSWVGEVEESNDPDFEQFYEMKFGLRAAFIILRTYLKIHGCCNISLIIHRWAPPNENNTEDYISFVCRYTGLDRYQKIQFEDKEKIIKIVQAMAIVESDKYLTFQDLEEAYDMA